MDLKGPQQLKRIFFALVSCLNYGRLHAGTQNRSQPVGLQEKLEAREPLEIDSFFDSNRDRLEKKRVEFEHFM